MRAGPGRLADYVPGETLIWRRGGVKWGVGTHELEVQRVDLALLQVGVDGRVVAVVVRHGAVQRTPAVLLLHQPVVHLPATRATRSNPARVKQRKPTGVITVSKSQRFSESGKKSKID